MLGHRERTQKPAREVISRAGFCVRSSFVLVLFWFYRCATIVSRTRRQPSLWQSPDCATGNISHDTRRRPVGTASTQFFVRLSAALFNPAMFPAPANHPVLLTGEAGCFSFPCFLACAALLLLPTLHETSYYLSFSGTRRYAGLCYLF